jgi:hypothetical protein
MKERKKSNLNVLFSQHSRMLLQCNIIDVYVRHSVAYIITISWCAAVCAVKNVGCAHNVMVIVSSIYTCVTRIMAYTTFLYRYYIYWWGRRERITAACHYYYSHPFLILYITQQQRTAIYCCCAAGTVAWRRLLYVQPNLFHVKIEIYIHAITGYSCVNSIYIQAPII